MCIKRKSRSEILLLVFGIDNQCYVYKILASGCKDSHVLEQKMAVS